MKTFILFLLLYLLPLVVEGEVTKKDWEKYEKPAREYIMSHPGWQHPAGGACYCRLVSVIELIKSGHIKLEEVDEKCKICETKGIKHCERHSVGVPVPLNW